MANIKKITLKNAAGVESVYSIFDEGALRLDSETKKLLTGNTVVDKVIIDTASSADGGFYISAVDDIPATELLDNEDILVWDRTTGELKRRSKDLLLADIGGTSHKLLDGGILSLQVGKQS